MMNFFRRRKLTPKEESAAFVPDEGTPPEAAATPQTKAVSWDTTTVPARHRHPPPTQVVGMLLVDPQRQQFEVKDLSIPTSSIKLADWMRQEIPSTFVSRTLRRQAWQGVVNSQGTFWSNDTALSDIILTKTPADYQIWAAVPRHETAVACHALARDILSDAHIQTMGQKVTLARSV
eukprot:scaffold1390_cov172-Amphora_coffeaeformis.AAC.6